MKHSTYTSYLIAFFLLALTGALLTHPQIAFAASLRGLQLWGTIVFPALLPFFVLSELLVAFGVVHFIGALLEPIMRKVFRLPGVAGYALAMSMASGSPSGARITVQLRNDRFLTREEAEHLMMFTNTANPLFIFGAIAIGFFHNPKIGLFLAVIHYFSSITIGFLFRYKTKKVLHTSRTYSSMHLIQSAFSLLHSKRLEEKRPIGKILGDAVTHSVHLLLMIGGFIMIFSVLNQLLIEMHITGTLAYLLLPFIKLANFHEQSVLPFLSGLLEMTLGIKNTSSLTTVSIIEKLSLISFLLGFSGFSVHAQVATILSQSDLRYFPFLLSRIIHGSIAYLLSLILLSIPSTTEFFFKPIETSTFYFAPSTNLFLSYLHVSPLFTLSILYIYFIYQVIYTKKKFQK